MGGEENVFFLEGEKGVSRLEQLVVVRGCRRGKAVFAEKQECGGGGEHPPWSGAAAPVAEQLAESGTVLETLVDLTFVHSRKITDLICILVGSTHQIEFSWQVNR